MATVTAEKALDLADAFRHGRSTARPLELWVLADREAGGVGEARRTIYRHAMIHAGYLLTAKGGPYKRCSMCHCALRR